MLIGPRPYPEPEKVRLSEKHDIEPQDEIAVTEPNSNVQDNEEA